MEKPRDIEAMTAYSWAFIVAGIIGSSVAIIHGVITQRMMIAPILEETQFPQSIRRLVPLLLHFSTIFWFFGGLVLIAAPFVLDTSATLTTAAFVGTFYAIGAVGNFWGTSGRHPGWILLAAAVALIVYGSMGLTS